MVNKPYHTTRYSTRDNGIPLWERLAVRALASAAVGKDYRRDIRKAQISARRAEAVEKEREERARRREDTNRAVELSYEIRRRAARV